MYRNFIRAGNFCYTSTVLSLLVLPYAFAANGVAAMEVRTDPAIFTSAAPQAPSIGMDPNSLVAEAPKVAEKIKSDMIVAEVALKKIKNK